MNACGTAASELHVCSESCVFLQDTWRLCMANRRDAKTTCVWLLKVASAATHARCPICLVPRNLAQLVDEEHTASDRNKVFFSQILFLRRPRAKLLSTPLLPSPATCRALPSILSQASALLVRALAIQRQTRHPRWKRSKLEARGHGNSTLAVIFESCLPEFHYQKIWGFASPHRRITLGTRMQRPMYATAAGVVSRRQEVCDSDQCASSLS